MEHINIAKGKKLLGPKNLQHGVKLVIPYQTTELVYTVPKKLNCNTQLYLNGLLKG
jgi:hypothetical protein